MVDYFLYISDSKVDMLLPQIPEKKRIKIAAEIGINVGVLKTTLKTLDETKSDENRIVRLKAVVRYISKSIELGTVDDSKIWIEDKQSVRVVSLPENKHVVFFIGQTSMGTKFALGGSAAHLLGRRETEEVSIGWSFLPDLLHGLRGVLNRDAQEIITELPKDSPLADIVRDNEFEWMDMIRVAQRISSSPKVKIKFLAKTLLSGIHRFDGIKTVLATPLYVKMDE